MRYRSVNVAKMALTVALMCVLAWVTIPFGQIPFTLQTLGVMITLLTLRGKRCVIAVSVYLLLGALGLPVFSAFGSGFGVLFGPTGGFLFGFLFGSVAYMLTDRFLGNSRIKDAISLLAFLVVCYGLGCGYYAVVYGGGLLSALTICVFPYIIPETMKFLLALIVGKRIGRYI